MNDPTATDISVNSIDSEKAYWFVGASWEDEGNQLERFLAEGIWENGFDAPHPSLEIVLKIKIGDRIAIKAAFVQNNGLPFDVGNKPVSAMRIKATGTVLNNDGDGRIVQVTWDQIVAPRDWYFYTYRTTISEADLSNEKAVRLVAFTFHHQPQDFKWFLNQPYWKEKYGNSPRTSIDNSNLTSSHNPDVELISSKPSQPYALSNIIDDGCFLAIDKLSSIYKVWEEKKNLILQGPPGTGKTWLAKRLGYVRVGSADRETTRSRLRVVQFHPSLSYEDFVRGWRPSGDGTLSLVDGILMQAIEAASSEPDVPFVLVIEEINRGNPAQVFGEMLTLLENTKRLASEAIELAYRKAVGERIHVPENLYIIGTMNIADRSLAIVDLALRRRFAFVDLEPTLGEEWIRWCQNHGIDEKVADAISTRINALNETISSAPSLGRQFRIGHSFVTPDTTISDPRAWFLAKIESEIGPLLDEYWYDAPHLARDARANLMQGWLE